MRRVVEVLDVEVGELLVSEELHSAGRGMRALDRRIGGDGVGGADLRSMGDDNLRRNAAAKRLQA
jgi:hypothetical protein